jgi:hypothetical protein
MIDYSLRGQPNERETDGGITMREIEAEVAGLYRDTLTANEVREKAFLFALLKQGSSLQKLQWFTGYEIDFIRERVEGLRSAGRLITNTPSTQFLQNQVAGCEALIERITGQRVVPMVNAAAPRIAIVVAESNPKEEPMDTTTLVNGAAEIEDFRPTCGKTEECGKPAGHMGRCKGPQLNHARRKAAAVDAKPRRSSKDLPEEQRAANAARMRLARAKNKSYARGPKAAPAAIPAAKPSVKADPGYFKIEFEDAEDTITREGHGRDGFARALKALYQEFAGE